MADRPNVFQILSQGASEPAPSNSFGRKQTTSTQGSTPTRPNVFQILQDPVDKQGGGSLSSTQAKVSKLGLQSAVTVDRKPGTKLTPSEFAGGVKTGILGGREDKGSVGNSLNFFAQDILGVPKSRQDLEDNKSGVIGIGTGVVQALLTPVGSLAQELTQLALGRDVAQPRLPFIGNVGTPEYTPEEIQAITRTLKRMARTATSSGLGNLIARSLVADSPEQTKKNLAFLEQEEIGLGPSINDALVSLGADPVFRTLALLDVLEVTLLPGQIASVASAIPDQTVSKQAKRLAGDLPKGFLAKQIPTSSTKPVTAINSQRLADDITSGLKTQIEEIFENPATRASLIDNGLTPQQARNALDNAIGLETRAQAKDEIIQGLRVQADELRAERVAQANKAIQVDKVKFLDNILPKKIATAERRLVTLTNAPARTVTSLRRVLSAVDTPLSSTILSLFDDVTPSSTSFEEASLLIDDARALVNSADLDVKDPLVTQLENIFDSFQSQFDEFNAVDASLLDDAAGIRQGVQDQLNVRTSRQLGRAGTGPISTLEKRITRAEEAAAGFRAEAAQLRQSPIGQILVQSTQAGFAPTQVISSRGVITTPEFIQQFDTAGTGGARDLNGFSRGDTSLTDPTRAAQTLDGEFRGPRMREFVEPAIAAKAAKQAAITRRTLTVDKFLDNIGIKPPQKGISGWAIQTLTPNGVKSVEASKRMFHAAEGNKVKLSAEEKEFVEWGQSMYDDYLTRLNDQRRQLNIKEIPRRENYVNHIRELTLAERSGLSLITEPDVTPSSIKAGRNKERSSFGAEKARETDLPGDEDFVGSVMTYINSAEKELNMNPVAAKINAIIPNLPNKQEKMYWQRWVNEAVLEGETNLDRFIDTVSPIRISSLFGKLSGITSRGALLANVNVAVLQPTTFFLNPAKFRTRHLLKATGELMTQEGRDFVKSNSIMRQIRGYEKVDLNPGNLTKTEDAMNYATAKLDMTMFDQSWLGAYRSSSLDLIDPKTGKHFNHADSVHYADIVAGQTQAMYDKLLVPPLLRSKTGRAVGQFGTFPINLWKQITTDIRNVHGDKGFATATQQFLTLYAGMWAANIAYESVGLRTPYEMAGTTDPEDLQQAIPLVGGTRTFGPPIIVKNLVAVLNVMFGDDNAQEKGMAQLKKDSVLLVPAGNQIRKTIGGVQAISDGYTTLGTQKIPIEGTSEELRALFLGKWGTRAAQKFFDEQRIKERQSK